MYHHIHPNNLFLSMYSTTPKNSTSPKNISSLSVISLRSNFEISPWETFTLELMVSISCFVSPSLWEEEAVWGGERRGGGKKENSPSIQTDSTNCSIKNKSLITVNTKFLFLDQLDTHLKLELYFDSASLESAPFGGAPSGSQSHSGPPALPISWITSQKGGKQVVTRMYSCLQVDVVIQSYDPSHNLMITLRDSFIVTKRLKLVSQARPTSNFHVFMKVVACQTLNRRFKTWIIVYQNNVMLYISRYYKSKARRVLLTHNHLCFPSCPVKGPLSDDERMSIRFQELLTGLRLRIGPPYLGSLQWSAHRFFSECWIRSGL